MAATVTNMQMCSYRNDRNMYPVLTMKNTVGYFDGKHYWKVDEKRMTCIDQQFMEEMHNNYCSNFGKWPTDPLNCSADGPGNPHVHENPRREQAEMALFGWRVKNAVIQTKKSGKPVDFLQIVMHKHRNFPFELELTPGRLLRYMKTSLENIIHEGKSDYDEADSVWDICTNAAADRFEMLLKQMDGPYGAGKQGDNQFVLLLKSLLLNCIVHFFLS